MKEIKKILIELIDKKISIDEAEGRIDFLIMSWDCPKRR